MSDVTQVRDEMCPDDRRRRVRSGVNEDAVQEAASGPEESTTERDGEADVLRRESREHIAPFGRALQISITHFERCPLVESDESGRRKQARFVGGVRQQANCGGRVNMTRCDVTLVVGAVIVDTAVQDVYLRSHRKCRLKETITDVLSHRIT